MSTPLGRIIGTWITNGLSTATPDAQVFPQNPPAPAVTPENLEGFLSTENLEARARPLNIGQPREIKNESGEVTGYQLTVGYFVNVVNPATGESVAILRNLELSAADSATLTNAENIKSILAESDKAAELGIAINASTQVFDAHDRTLKNPIYNMDNDLGNSLYLPAINNGQPLGVRPWRDAYNTALQIMEFNPDDEAVLSSILAQEPEIGRDITGRNKLISSEDGKGVYAGNSHVNAVVGSVLTNIFEKLPDELTFISPSDMKWVWDNFLNKPENLQAMQSIRVMYNAAETTSVGVENTIFNPFNPTTRNLEDGLRASIPEGSDGKFVVGTGVNMRDLNLWKTNADGSWSFEKDAEGNLKPNLKVSLQHANNTDLLRSIAVDGVTYPIKVSGVYDNNGVLTPIVSEAIAGFSADFFTPYDYQMLYNPEDKRFYLSTGTSFSADDMAGLAQLCKDAESLGFKGNVIDIAYLVSLLGATPVEGASWEKGAGGLTWYNDAAPGIFNYEAAKQLLELAAQHPEFKLQDFIRTDHPVINATKQSMPDGMAYEATTYIDSSGASKNAVKLTIDPDKSGLTDEVLLSTVLDFNLGVNKNVLRNMEGLEVRAIISYTDENGQIVVEHDGLLRHNPGDGSEVGIDPADRLVAGNLSLAATKGRTISFVFIPKNPDGVSALMDANISPEFAVHLSSAPYIQALKDMHQAVLSDGGMYLHQYMLSTYGINISEFSNPSVEAMKAVREIVTQSVAASAVYSSNAITTETGDIMIPENYEPSASAPALVEATEAVLQQTPATSLHTFLPLVRR